MNVINFICNNFFDKDKIQSKIYFTLNFIDRVFYWLLLLRE